MAFLFTLYQNIWLFIALISLVAIWDLIWKGIALWFAGKNQQKGWFVVLLIFNTAGILPIIYLLCCRDANKAKPTKKVHENKGFAPEKKDEVVTETPTQESKTTSKSTSSKKSAKKVAKKKKKTSKK